MATTWEIKDEPATDGCIDCLSWTAAECICDRLYDEARERDL